MLPALLPLSLALAAAPAAAAAGLRHPGRAAPAAAVCAALAAAATLWGWLAGGAVIDVAWAPAWDLRLELALDGLAAPYVLLATGVGALVFVYAWRYVPLHLEHQEQPAREALRFSVWMAIFMAAMVGLAMARDLVLLFVCWELTTIASYYLIAFDRHRHETHPAALMALMVTGVSAVLLLAGALCLHAAYGTFSIPELAARAEPGPAVAIATALITVAALAKSAQLPLHYWLPRAMVAPTPVSAYLHSAAMVAAGVLLIGRIYPLLEKTELLLDALVVVGALSTAVGGVLALTRDELKPLLAYSTIAQYGLVCFLYGLGGVHGAAGAVLYVLAHAIAKSALFLTAGAVTQATGESRLSKLGGLRRRLPLLAASSAVAAATLAALPLTLGFFKDEMLFAAALERGPLFACLAVALASLTVAYTWRFWSGIFLGGERAPARHSGRPIPAQLTLPVTALAAIALAGGFYARPFERLAELAGPVSLGRPTPLDASYHLDAKASYLMALGAYGLGALLVLSRRLWSPATAALARIGDAIGPERLHRAAVHGLNRASDAVHALEIRNLRGRVAAILLPTGLLVGAGVLATLGSGSYRIGFVRGDQVPLIIAFAAVALAALTTTVTRQHLSIALVLSSSGFLLVLIYAIFGAPNVMLVAVVIEMMLTLLLLGALSLMPRELLRHQETLPLSRPLRTALVSAVAGGFAFVIVWGSLSQPPAGTTVAAEYVALAPAAHAKNVVAAILADFRGLDTLGEITVLAAVLLGVAALLEDGALHPSGRAAIPGGGGPPANVAQRAVTRLLLLPTLLVAAAILVKGYEEVGDGFSAGIVAALGVLSWQLTHGRGAAERLAIVRRAPVVALAGLLLSLAVALAPLLAGDALLTHAPERGHEPVHLGTLAIATGLLFDVGVFLLVFGFAVATVSIVARTVAREGPAGAQESGP